MTAGGDCPRAGQPGCAGGSLAWHQAQSPWPCRRDVCRLLPVSHRAKRSGGKHSGAAWVTRGPEQHAGTPGCAGSCRVSQQPGAALGPGTKIGSQTPFLLCPHCLPLLSSKPSLCGHVAVCCACPRALLPPSGFTAAARPRSLGHARGPAARGPWGRPTEAPTASL